MIGRSNHCKCFRVAFEGNCIKLLVSAYHKAIMEKSINLDWQENDITAQLHIYIDNNPFRIKKHISTSVEYHLVNKDLPKVRGFASHYSRIDMRFVVFKSKLEYIYFAEAKLLKEHDSKLKRRYIKTGIDNFKSQKYYSGCLLAYFVEGILINTIDGINKFLKSDNRASEVLTKSVCSYHNEYYESCHNPIDILKHIIFDFTNCGLPHA